MDQNVPETMFKKVLDNIPIHLLVYSLIALIILISYGIIGSLLIMKLNLIDSIYFTIITIATLGYGDITPLTEGQKVFSVTLAIGGVGLVAYVFSLSISLVGQRIEELRSGVKMRRIIKSLKGHYILCGYGRVGAVVVANLQKIGQKVVVIDKNRDTIEKLEEEKRDIFAIHGDATDERTLQYAGIEKAIGLILATGNDVDNLFITLSSREISKDLWIVSRAVKKENVRRLYNSGANKVISPAESGGGDIYSAAIQTNLINVTVKHYAKDIKREMEIILNHGCWIENIEYYYPHLKEPLKRKIGTYSQKQLSKFFELMEKDRKIEQSIELIYESVNGIHSHLIAGTDKKTLYKLVEALKKENLVLGVDLSPDEIREIVENHWEDKPALKEKEN